MKTRFTMSNFPAREKGVNATIKLAKNTIQCRKMYKKEGKDFFNKITDLQTELKIRQKFPEIHARREKIKKILMNAMSKTILSKDDWKRIIRFNKTIFEIIK